MTQRHDDVSQAEQSPPGNNPLAREFGIVVTKPRNIQVRMVDASALADYEIWVFVASLLSNVVVGFIVAYIQAVDANSKSKTSIFWTVVIWIVLFTIAIGMAISKRASLRRQGRDIKLKTTGASLAEPP